MTNFSIVKFSPWQHIRISGKTVCWICHRVSLFAFQLYMNFSLNRYSYRPRPHRDSLSRSHIKSCSFSLAHSSLSQSKALERFYGFLCCCTERKWRKEKLSDKGKKIRKKKMLTLNFSFVLAQNEEKWKNVFPSRLSHTNTHNFLSLETFS